MTNVPVEPEGNESARFKKGDEYLFRRVGRQEESMPDVSPMDGWFRGKSD
jgi:hypothetical protein